jgi:hypothetical protein
MPVAGEQADADRIPARHQPIAVRLDLVDRARPGERSVGREG